MLRKSEIHVRYLALASTLSAMLVVFGCGSSEPSNDKELSAGASCPEPENPYSEGTGHYAGYEWAEKHDGTCSSSSASFNEGCEEYDSQESLYQQCEAAKKR